MRDFFMEKPIPVEALEESARREEGKAVVTLQAVVRRDREAGDELHQVIYEAERGRAEDALEHLAREVGERWRGAVLVLRHRLGAVLAGETSVFMAVTSPRREDALAACHHAMERLRRLPGLRKRDVFKSGADRLCLEPHETLLLSDDVFSLPQS